MQVLKKPNYIDYIEALRDGIITETEYINFRLSQMEELD